MENTQLISVFHFCVAHHIDNSFIESLQQYGLVEVTTVEDKPYLQESQLDLVERFIRLHYEMDVNLEGIEVITHLLDKLKQAQEHARQLQNRLGLYENQITSHN